MYSCLQQLLQKGPIYHQNSAIYVRKTLEITLLIRIIQQPLFLLSFDDMVKSATRWQCRTKDWGLRTVPEGLFIFALHLSGQN